MLELATYPTIVLTIGDCIEIEINNGDASEYTQLYGISGDFQIAKIPVGTRVPVTKEQAQANPSGVHESTPEDRVENPETPQYFRYLPETRLTATDANLVLFDRRLPVDYDWSVFHDSEVWSLSEINDNLSVLSSKKEEDVQLFHFHLNGQDLIFYGSRIAGISYKDSPGDKSHIVLTITGNNDSMVFSVAVPGSFDNFSEVSELRSPAAAGVSSRENP